MKETVPTHPPNPGRTSDLPKVHGANWGQSRSNTQLPKLKSSVFMLKLTEGMLLQFASPSLHSHSIERQHRVVRRPELCSCLCREWICFCPESHLTASFVNGENYLCPSCPTELLWKWNEIRLWKCFGKLNKCLVGGLLLFCGELGKDRTMGLFP